MHHCIRCEDVMSTSHVGFAPDEAAPALVADALVPCTAEGQRAHANDCDHRCTAAQCLGTNSAGALVPCTAEGQSALVCARAGELAASGRELCAAAGFAISDDAGRCWSGAGEAAVLDSCRAAAEPAAGKRGPLPAAAAAAAAKKKADAAKKNAKKARKKAKSRSKKAAGAAYTTADILLLAAVGAVSLWAGWRLLTAAPLLRGGGPDSVRFPGASQKLGTAKIRQ